MPITYVNLTSALNISVIHFTDVNSHRPLTICDVLVIGAGVVGTSVALKSATAASTSSSSTGGASEAPSSALNAEAGPP